MRGMSRVPGWQVMIVISLFLPIALGITMFSLGIGLTRDDFLRVATQPKAFAVGAILQLAILPLTAYGVAVASGLPPVLALGLVILGLCPGGATSNLFAKFAGGDVALSVSLTAVITIVSVFTIPLAAAAALNHFIGSGPQSINISSVAVIMLLTIVIPVLLGMLARERWPAWADRTEKPLNRVTVIIIGIIVTLAVAANWRTFIDNVGVVSTACLALQALMLAAGVIVPRLAGLNRSQATSIAIDTSMQNAAMGIAICGLLAQGNPALTATAIPAGVYGLLMYFTSLAFVFWRRRALA
jgi:bile acid:Na+ symporter, BASS family